MRAHNRQLWKFTVQALNIRKRSVLDVQDHGFRTASFHFLPQLVMRLSHVYRKVSAESAGQGPGHARIFLKKYNTMDHTSPDSYVGQRPR